MTDTKHDPSAQHTPGPWEISTDPDEHVLPNFSHIEVGLWPCGIIARVDPHNEMPQLSEANARLIAAAPELLEAAELLAAFVRDFARTLPEGEQNTKHHGLAVCLNNHAGDLLLAAIAKARGEGREGA